MLTIPTVTLNDGTAFPELGLGTYGLRGADGVAAVISAIESGYRLLDTAVNYENEREVGEAVRSSGIDRDELLVTTKIPGRSHGYDEAIESTNGSLAVLGPRPHRPVAHPLAEPERGQVRRHVAGDDRPARERVVRSIGVSNFTEAMLTRLIDETGVTPSVNQVELHPYFPQGDLRAFHAEHGIRTESWSPLARRSELLRSRCCRSSPRSTASPRRRSCCAGTCRSAARPFRSPPTPTGSARTPTCSSSS